MSRLLSSAQWAAEIGLSSAQARRLLRDGRVPEALRVGERAWAIPGGTPKPDSLPTGALAHKRPTSDAAAAAAEQYIRHEGG